MYGTTFLGRTSTADKVRGQYMDSSTEAVQCAAGTSTERAASVLQNYGSRVQSVRVWQNKEFRVIGKGVPFLHIDFWTRTNHSIIEEKDYRDVSKVVLPLFYPSMFTDTYEECIV